MLLIQKAKTLGIEIGYREHWVRHKKDEIGVGVLLEGHIQIDNKAEQCVYA